MIGRPLAASGDYGVTANQYDRVAFAPVNTTALRLEVKLQPEFSAGIEDGSWINRPAQN